MVRLLYPVAIAILGLLLACSGDSTSDTSPTSTVSRTTSAPTVDTPTAEPSAMEAPPAEIAIGDAVDFPDNVALIVETGCWSCDGPTTGFVRVYRRPDGSIAQDILLTIDQLNLPDGGDNASPSILNFKITHDASEIVIAVCVTGLCGGLGPPAPEGTVATLYRSTDGGVSWAEWADLPLEFWMIGLVADGVLVGRQTNIDASEKPNDPSATPNVTAVSPEYEFLVLPEGSVVTPPGEAGSSAWPVVADSGEIWWPDDEGRLLRGDGSVVFSLPDPEASIGRVRGHLKSGLLVDWRKANPDGFYLTLFEGSGLEPGSETLTVKSTDYLVAHAGPWTFSPEHDKSLTLYGNIDPSLAGIDAPTPLNFGLVPALIDPGDATARPIFSPFADGTSILPNARNRVFAVQQGPFARVTGTGSCLNLRASPSASAEILTCAVDGVLLQDTGHTADADGRTWLEVGHPSGLSAWAATDFLER